MENQKFWWKAGEKEGHSLVTEHINFLNKKQASMTEDTKNFVRLYGSTEVLGFRNHAYSQQDKLKRLTLNVVQAACDTASAKIAKNRPKATFLTQEGSYTDMMKAKRLEKYVEGVIYQSDIYDKMARCFLDACVVGTGVMKLYYMNGKVQADRCFLEEIRIDEDEALHGSPRSMHQVKFVNKHVLAEKYPEYSLQIMQAEAASHSYMVNRFESDMIQIRESWHLPSGPDAGDGIHAISIDGATLLWEEYEKSWFPFEFFRWNERILGFFGQGIAEQLMGLQYEINKLLRRIQLAIQLCSVPRFMVENGSKVVKSHLNNQVGSIVTYSGTPPQLQAGGGVPAELFAQLENLYNKAFQIIGVNQLSATGMKPMGLNSGAALREYNDIQTDRFAVIAQRYEQFGMNIAKKIIMISKEMSERKENLEVKVASGKSIAKIKWEEIDLDEDSYVMKVYPTSLLPSHPSGRLQTVQELLSVGLLDRTQVMRLLDYPDLESITSLENAGLDDIQRTIELIIDEGEYNSPEPYQDLKLGIKLCQSSYLKYKTMGVDDERLDLLRRWIDDAMALISPPEEVAAPDVAVMGEVGDALSEGIVSLEE